jgi:Superfamily II DNA and RNA helicases
VTPDNKVSTLVDLLNEDGTGLALVFVRTKAGADRLVEKLRRHDVDAVSIHGDKGQAQRERALERFDSGKVKTLVATDVAARGLDIDDITHVINFDRPRSRRLHAPRRPHGSRGQGRHRHHARPPGPAGRRLTRRPHAGPGREVRGAGLTLAKPKLVYTSRRRGGRSKW